MPPVDASAAVDPARRNVLRLSGIAGLAFAGSALLPAEAGAATAAAQVEGEAGMAAQPTMATPICPPAVPLA
ncbi:MAG TPA: hypothetical protein VF738_02550, partial [Rhodanobacter sp.]